MKVLDLITYDYVRECFVLRDSIRPRVLNPWEELALIDRPSIFMQDVRFRARQPTGTISSEEGLGYKQFGTFSRAKEPSPNKHAGTLKHATVKTNGATKTKGDQAIRETGDDIKTAWRGGMASGDAGKEGTST
tara:strand:+ start:135 stop:533 length:399 start_codon:yes stop_codon:yes gene_type:complete